MLCFLRMYTVFLKFSMVLQHLCRLSVIASSLIASCSMACLSSSCRQPRRFPPGHRVCCFPPWEFSSWRSVHPRLVCSGLSRNLITSETLCRIIIQTEPFFWCVSILSVEYPISQLEFLHSSFPHFRGLIYYKNKYAICHVYGYLSCSITNFYYL